MSNNPAHQLPPIEQIPEGASQNSLGSFPYQSSYIVNIRQKTHISKPFILNLA